MLSAFSLVHVHVPSSPNTKQLALVFFFIRRLISKTSSPQPAQAYNLTLVYSPKNKKETSSSLHIFLSAQTLPKSLNYWEFQIGIRKYRKVQAMLLPLLFTLLLTATTPINGKPLLNGLDIETRASHGARELLAKPQSRPRATEAVRDLKNSQLQNIYTNTFSGGASDTLNRTISCKLPSASNVFLSHTCLSIIIYNVWQSTSKSVTRELENPKEKESFLTLTSIYQYIFIPSHDPP